MLTVFCCIGLPFRMIRTIQRCSSGVVRLYTFCRILHCASLRLDFSNLDEKKKTSYCLPIFWERSSKTSLSSRIERLLSMTEERALTTSNKTAEKSPWAFYTHGVRTRRASTKLHHRTKRTSVPAGLFQFRRRIASGSLIPKGINLMYVFARFFSFSP